MTGSKQIIPIFQNKLSMGVSPVHQNNQIVSKIPQATDRKPGNLEIGVPAHIAVIVVHAPINGIDSNRHPGFGKSLV